MSVEAKFKCEKCGTNLLVSKHNRPQDVAHNIYNTVTTEDMTCSQCAKLTYGPITEEMVAEALISVADRWYKERSAQWEKKVLYGYTDEMQHDLSLQEARFVLRLLDWANPMMRSFAYQEGDNPETYRQQHLDMLLDLARQK